jgi:hypothetical protein
MEFGKKVIHVHINESDENRYFGSITAMLNQTNNGKDLGVTRKALYGSGFATTGTFSNDICVITRGEIERMPGNRKAPVRILRVI